jgi:hypothetical protein
MDFLPYEMQEGMAWNPPPYSLSLGAGMFIALATFYSPQAPSLPPSRLQSTHFKNLQRPPEQVLSRLQPDP